MVEKKIMLVLSRVQLDYDLSEVFFCIASVLGRAPPTDGEWMIFCYVLLAFHLLICYTVFLGETESWKVTT